ncbi:hypothetical protein SAMN02744778_04485 [Pantoea sp. GL120224-02]|jgi:hypothetical protein|nr:hypothetical protein SAMN02744778_04485 [Pantoea sp. GL120224-02]
MKILPPVNSVYYQVILYLNLKGLIIRKAHFQLTNQRNNLVHKLSENRIIL